MTLRFTVPIAAVGKGRPRVVSRAGKTHAFTPDKTVIFERTVALYARAAVAQARDWPRGAHYSLRVKVRKSSVEVEVETLERIQRASRFDLDNIAKAVGDALNGIAYEDDRAIVELHAEDAGK